MKFDISNNDLFNDIYIPLLYDNNRNIIIYGGRDSGKSDFAAQMVITETLTQPYSKFILLRKIYADIKDSQFQTIVDYIYEWGLEDYFHITKSPLDITCKINGNKIIARGLDRPTKTKSIKDPTGIWYEEADEISFVDYIKSSDSIRSSKNVRFREIFTFNSERESCWLNWHFFPDKQTYEKEDGNFHFIKSIQPDTTILHTTYKDNKWVTKDRARKREALKDIDFSLYRIYTPGLWGDVHKGLIYPKWQTYSDRDAISGTVLYGLDFGYVDYTALTKVSVDENKVYIEELIYETGLLTKELINRLEDLGIKTTDEMYADAARPDMIQEIYYAGFNIHPADKSVEEGILFVKGFELYIHEDSKNIQSEINKYQWAVDKDGNPLEKPVKKDDHTMDTIRYALFSHRHYLSYKGTGVIAKRSERRAASRSRIRDIIKNR